MRQIISSNNAPKAKGLLSQAILTDSKYRMEISGQIGINPETGKLEEGGIEAQTVQTFKNISAILSEVGWDLSDLIKVRIFLTDMNDYDKVNKIYSGYFSVYYPTRLAMAVKQLPLGALIEVDCVAAGDEIK